LAVAVAAPGGSDPVAAVDPAGTETIDTVIARRLAVSGPVLIAGQTLRHAESVREVYARRGFEPGWLASRSPASADGRAGESRTLGASAQAVRRVLETAADDGLDPAAYHTREIEALAAASDVQAEADLDLLLTDGVMGYVLDLRAGRIPPRVLDPELGMTPPRPDPVAAALGAMAVTDPAAALAAYTPPQPDYGALRRLLAAWRVLQRGGGWPVPGPGPVIRPGGEDAAIPAIRRELMLQDDLPGRPEGREGAQRRRYDPALVEAVRRFQARNGLAADGVIGAPTRAALNIDIDQRLTQLEANMERWRWMPDSLGERYVFVNEAGYFLKAVDGDTPPLILPVIIGKTDLHTPMLIGQMNQVVFNPTWSVPLSIARKEYLPKLIRNPGSLSAQGFVVTETLGSRSRVLDPAAVDWRSVGSGIGHFRLKQMPGPRNALGRVKFLFPNDYAVYLHDTPGRDKFTRVERSLSHGCVRVGDPRSLADFVFAGQPDWASERWDQMMADGDTRTLTLRRPLPVYLFYQTLWVDDKGVVQSRDDIYGRDAAWRDAISRRTTPVVRPAIPPAVSEAAFVP
jgi:murein L,D-transpeptidase YcbB/YkuD